MRQVYRCPEDQINMRVLQPLSKTIIVRRILVSMWKFPKISGPNTDPKIERISVQECQLKPR